MTPPSPFVRTLLGNMRVSLLVILIAALIAAAYGMIASVAVPWGMLGFLAGGMVLSSVFHAWRDTRKVDG